VFREDRTCGSDADKIAANVNEFTTSGRAPSSHTKNDRFSCIAVLPHPQKLDRQAFKLEGLPRHVAFALPLRHNFQFAPDLVFGEKIEDACLWTVCYWRIVGSGGCAFPLGLIPRCISNRRPLPVENRN
jgi:hypothetical protein